MTTLSPAEDYLDLYGESAAESGHEEVCVGIYIHRCGNISSTLPFHWLKLGIPCLYYLV